MESTTRQFPKLPPVESFSERSVHGSRRGDERTQVWGRGHFSLMERPKFGSLERETMPLQATMPLRGTVSHSPREPLWSDREKEILRQASQPIKPLTPGILKNGRTIYGQGQRRVGSATTTNGLNLWETSTMAANRSHHGLKAFS